MFKQLKKFTVIYDMPTPLSKFLNYTFFIVVFPYTHGLLSFPFYIEN